MEFAGAFLRMVGPSAWNGPRTPLFVSAALTAPETVVNAAAHPQQASAIVSCPCLHKTCPQLSTRLRRSPRWRHRRPHCPCHELDYRCRSMQRDHRLLSKAVLMDLRLSSSRFTRSQVS